MYDLQYVRKKRRRRIAALMALFASFGVASFVIISFLGRTMGTFTVALNNSEVNLALVEKEHSTDYSTYLRVNSNSNYIEGTFEDLKHKLDILDDEETPSNVGEKDQTYVDKADGKVKTGKCLEYFKYTFYVKNIGNKTAAYSLKINIDDRTRSDDDTGRSLDDTLRVMARKSGKRRSSHIPLRGAIATWVWVLIIPGMTMSPDASMTWSASPLYFLPTETILSPSTTMSPLRMLLFSSCVTIHASRMTVIMKRSVCCSLINMRKPQYTRGPIVRR